MTNESVSIFIAYHNAWPRPGSIEGKHSCVYLNLASVMQRLAFQLFLLWGGVVFMGLFFSFSEALSFMLVVYSLTRQLGDLKANVTVYNTILDQNRKGFVHCVLGVCCLIQ